MRTGPNGALGMNGRSPQHAPAQSRIFDIAIDLGRPAELLRRITGWVGHGGPARRVMYVNAHVLNQSQEIPELRTALESADLVYCDGYGVRLAARALDVPIPFSPVLEDVTVPTPETVAAEARALVGST